jgi:hypothetical protein
MALLLNAIACVVLGVLRAAGHKSVVFQAIAHVYIGGLFKHAWDFRATETWAYMRRCPGARSFPVHRNWYWALAWALSFVELFTAIYQRTAGVH